LPAETEQISSSIERPDIFLSTSKKDLTGKKAIDMLAAG
jgi:hypothetical protein